MLSPLSEYRAAFIAANPGRSVPSLATTKFAGWFLIGGERVARKTLREMTERLRNRAAGIAQLTDAELAANSDERGLGR